MQKINCLNFFFGQWLDCALTFAHTCREVQVVLGRNSHSYTYLLIPLVRGCKTLSFLRKKNWFILKFRTLSVFSIRSCMIFFFPLHFYPSPVLWSFSDSQQWLGLPSLFGLQKVIVFGSVIMHLAFLGFFCFGLFFFFFHVKFPHWLCLHSPQW